MERGDEVGEAPEPVVDHSAGSLDHQRRQAAVVGHPAHHPEVVAHLTVGPDQVCHAEMDVRPKPAVQLDLTKARGLPGRPVPEVEEAEVDRLLQLLRAVAHQHDDGRVGLPDRGRCVGAHAPAFQRDPSGSGHSRRPVTRSGTSRIQCALSLPATDRSPTVGRGRTWSRRTA